MIKRTKTIFVIVVTILATIIFLQNSESVIFRILFWEVTLPRIVMMVIIFVVGIIIGFLLNMLGRKPAPLSVKEEESPEEEAGETA